jgi:hypothetical protein
VAKPGKGSRLAQRRVRAAAFATPAPGSDVLNRVAAFGRAFALAE